VLILEEESSVAPLEALARSEGAQVIAHADVAEGLKIARNHQVDLVLAGSSLPGQDALQILRMLRAQEHRHLPVIVTLPAGDRARRLEALRLGADDVIVAPWDEEEARARLARVLAQKQRFDELLVESARLHELSVTDGLTSVYNHRFFQDRLREEFRRAQRYDDPLALILLDLDHFKDVNDTHGHQMGDVMLREVADVLRRGVRETDLLARYGGEEFAILLPKTHLAGALTVAERVWRDVGTLRTGQNGALCITASLGVSGFPGRTVISADRLLRTADEALYRAKRQGRNRICLHQQTAAPPPTPSPTAPSSLPGDLTLTLGRI